MQIIMMNVLMISMIDSHTLRYHHNCLVFRRRQCGHCIASINFFGRFNGRSTARYLHFGHHLPQIYCTCNSLPFLLAFRCNDSIFVMKSLLIGFISGITVGLFLSIGSMSIPRPKVSLTTFTDNCPQYVVNQVIHRFQSMPNTTNIATYEPMWEYFPLITR